jgi:hypothetical protein
MKHPQKTTHWLDIFSELLGGDCLSKFFRAVKVSSILSEIAAVLY